MMSHDTSCLNDPARLAAEVRRLAAEAHETLKNPSRSPRSTDELTRRIRTLQHQLSGHPPGDLGLWLDNLHSRVDRARRKPDS